MISYIEADLFLDGLGDSPPPPVEDRLLVVVVVVLTPLVDNLLLLGLFWPRPFRVPPPPPLSCCSNNEKVSPLRGENSRTQMSER